jgi:hypothetical protein
MAMIAFEAGKTNGRFIGVRLNQPIGWFVMVRVLLRL